MKNTPEKPPMSREDALQLLEEIKKQYALQLEICRICDLVELLKSMKSNGDGPISTGTTISTLY